jgi:hypothetical protein
MDELHHVVWSAVVFAEPVDRNNIGVVKLGSRPRLPFEPFFFHWIAKNRARKQFERDPSTERDLLRFIDDTHPAAANHSQQAKIAQMRHRCGVWLRHG